MSCHAESGSPPAHLAGVMDEASGLRNGDSSPGSDGLRMTSIIWYATEHYVMICISASAISYFVTSFGCTVLNL